MTDRVPKQCSTVRLLHTQYCRRTSSPHWGLRLLSYVANSQQCQVCTELAGAPSCVSRSVPIRTNDVKIKVCAAFGCLSSHTLRVACCLWFVTAAPVECMPLSATLSTACQLLARLECAGPGQTDEHTTSRGGEGQCGPVAGAEASGVCCVADAAWPLLSLMLVSAPAAMSACTTASCSCAAAQCSAVRPLLSCLSRGGCDEVVEASRARVMGSKPPPLATCSGV